MPEHARSLTPRPSAPAGRCSVPACVVCAVEAERRTVTVAEWLVGRLRPLVRRAQRPPPTTSGWPYSSWWEESGR
ncbi:hypothetical protein [Quadrisphaera setariae]|uniref:Uncharacterized protein n=1 Tax=Quadrisphaera setariae TaxID=2593304 RepID=A0A5C8ZHV3_9ACTN|nr:hypothetical protein [Quadrisphaera setariae]TXR57437.1 hypothetical protein FMM08_04080 [Quadrisphaera setariae]